MVKKYILNLNHLKLSQV